MSTPREEVGLALSGGGFRAAAFHLGVLKRLEELAILPRVRLLSTVSGGSITGGLYALLCSREGDGTPGSVPVERLIELMRPLLTGNLRGRALLGNPLRAARTVLSFTLPGVRRMPLLVDELDRSLFHGARLPDLPPWIVINATNLRTGKAWKFYRDRMGDYLAGVTRATAETRVAEAVGASAAYPGLVDPSPLHARWEDLGEPKPGEGWQTAGDGSGGRWRSRYGRPEGTATFPLVDGGIYDNEGINSLRGVVRHAIISCAAPPEADLTSRQSVRALLRTVDVMHSRLGALGRQFAHEATHAVHPGRARREIQEIAGELRALSAETGRTEPAALADRLDAVAGVGWPPRGPQFASTAQILLARTDVAENRSAEYAEEPFDVPAEDRGLSRVLVEELSRLRTDLDAYSPAMVDLLASQAYFLTDATLKIAMPSVVRDATGAPDVRDPSLRPGWAWAQQVIRTANAHEAHTCSEIRAQQERTKLGRGSLRG